MHPELFTLPIVGVSIKTYGFFLMIGFLTAVWLAMRRARRVNASPDTVLDISFLLLIFGVAGARIFYVVHYWKTQFANAPNKLLAVIDITQGGLEFLGGFLGGLLALVIYAAWKRFSLRLYLDIITPSVMWGLALGRLGCFFNGCCFGGVCTVPSGDAVPAGRQAAQYPWAVRFPYGSPAHWRQWEDRKVTVPAELIVTENRSLQPILVPASLLSMSVEARQRPIREYEDALKRYERAKTRTPESEETAQLKKQLEALRKKKEAHEDNLAALRLAQRYPSRVEPSRPISVSELDDLAAQCTSLPVHPTQLYSSIHAFLLYGLLAAVFAVRRRHGMVLGVLLILYPIGRVLLEMIRADNPHDVAGLTVSQFVSLMMFVTGVLYLSVLYRYLPLRSPHLAAETASGPANRQ